MHVRLSRRPISPFITHTIPLHDDPSPVFRRVRVVSFAGSLAACVLLCIPQASATATATTAALNSDPSGGSRRDLGRRRNSSNAHRNRDLGHLSRNSHNAGTGKVLRRESEICEDSALLATAQLTTAGTATFKFRPGIGSHTYQAVFVGTQNAATSISAMAALSVTGKFPTTTTIASSGSMAAIPSPPP